MANIGMVAVKQTHQNFAQILEQVDRSPTPGLPFATTVFSRDRPCCSHDVVEAPDVDVDAHDSS